MHCWIEGGWKRRKEVANGARIKNDSQYEYGEWIGLWCGVYRISDISRQEYGICGKISSLSRLYKEREKKWWYCRWLSHSQLLQSSSNQMKWKIISNNQPNMWHFYPISVACVHFFLMIFTAFGWAARVILGIFVDGKMTTGAMKEEKKCCEWYESKEILINI